MNEEDVNKYFDECIKKYEELGVLNREFQRLPGSGLLIVDTKILLYPKDYFHLKYNSRYPNNIVTVLKPPKQDGEIIILESVIENPWILEQYVDTKIECGFNYKEHSPTKKPYYKDPYTKVALNIKGLIKRVKSPKMQEGDKLLAFCESYRLGPFAQSALVISTLWQTEDERLLGDFSDKFCEKEPAIYLIEQVKKNCPLTLEFSKSDFYMPPDLFKKVKQ